MYSWPAVASSKAASTSQKDLPPKSGQGYDPQFSGSRHAEEERSRSNTDGYRSPSKRKRSSKSPASKYADYDDGAATHHAESPYHQGSRGKGNASHKMITYDEFREDRARLMESIKATTTRRTSDLSTVGQLVPPRLNACMKAGGVNLGKMLRDDFHRWLDVHQNGEVKLLREETPYKKTRSCNFFKFGVSGSCTNGNHCRFRHSLY